MSGFIVSNNSLRRVVQAASAFQSNNPDARRRVGTAFENVLFGFPDGARYLDLGDEADLLRLTQELYDLNAAAYVARYPREAEDVRAFDPADFSSGFAVGLHHDFDSRVAAYKAASCLRYQCSEGDVPEQPLYKALVQFIGDLACETIDETDEYDACPWG